MIMNTMNKYQLKKIGIQSEPDKYVIACISEADLDYRLVNEVKKFKIVGSEQWYRDPKYWYRVRSNPLYDIAKRERDILEKNKSEISKLIARMRKVFFGIGTGEVEQNIIKLDFCPNRKTNYSEIIVVDICSEFITNCADILKSYHRKYQNWTMRYLGFQQLFEDFNLNNYEIPTRYNRSAFVCLGNTIGNFIQDQIFMILSNNMRKDDLLLLGFEMLNNETDYIESYKTVGGFRSLVDAIVQKIISIKIPGMRSLFSSTTWKFNNNGNWVEAVSNDTVIFRSKKYVPGEVSKMAKKYRLIEVFTDEDSDIGLNIYRKY